MNTAALNRLREKHLHSDNEACFIERQHILHSHRDASGALPVSERYPFELRLLAEGLSTPIDSDDLFAGSMVEARWDLPEPLKVTPLHPGSLWSQGHITIDCESILQKGLAGIISEVKNNAARMGTAEAADFARHAEHCVESIRIFCRRYADAARKAGKAEMARALEVVPFKPAYDFYSALQSVWMVQFVCSALIGERDFAIGRIDRWLLPYCSGERAREVELLAFFFMKFNEIKGTTTDNYRHKPIPCFASNQYLVLGPEFNRISEMVIEAAKAVRLPQPGINFRLRDDFTLAARAAHTLDSQGNFFNDKLIYNKLLSSGFPPEIAGQYAFTACNRVDLPGVLPNFMEWIDTFCNSTEWFSRAVHTAGDVDEVLPNLKKIAFEELLANTGAVLNVHDTPAIFHFESLFNRRCIQSCRDIRSGGGNAIRWKHCMFSGIATMADSLNALRFMKQRLSYREILEILDADFAGHEALRQEIRNTLPKYGNGIPEADAAATEIGNLLIDAFEEACRINAFIPMPSFYSLTQHHPFGASIGATPDGRLAGEPVSENQSAVYGMDRNSPTAMLRSAAALPHHRCICGGLNLKFGSKVPAEQLESLLRSYFQMGGLHLGFTTVERATLEKARQTPEKFRDLLIRKTGFSEYFINLSPAEQQELIDRTEY